MQNQARYDNLWLRNRCQPIFQLFVTEDLSFDQYVNTCQLYGQPTRRHDGEYLSRAIRHFDNIQKLAGSIYYVFNTFVFLLYLNLFPSINSTFLGLK